MKDFMHKRDLAQIRMYAHWFRDFCPEMRILAKMDKPCLDLQERIAQLESAYEAVKAKFPLQDQETLDMYVSFCEGLEQRFAQLIYRHMLLDATESERAWFMRNKLDIGDF